MEWECYADWDFLLDGEISYNNNFLLEIDSIIELSAKQHNIDVELTEYKLTLRDYKVVTLSNIPHQPSLNVEQIMATFKCRTCNVQLSFHDNSVFVHVEGSSDYNVALESFSSRLIEKVYILLLEHFGDSCVFGPLPEDCNLPQAPIEKQKSSGVVLWWQKLKPIYKITVGILTPLAAIFTVLQFFKD